MVVQPTRMVALVALAMMPKTGMMLMRMTRTAMMPKTGTVLMGMTKTVLMRMRRGFLSRLSLLRKRWRELMARRRGLVFNSSRLRAVSPLPLRLPAGQAVCW